MMWRSPRVAERFCCCLMAMAIGGCAAEVASVDVDGAASDVPAGSETSAETAEDVVEPPPLPEDAPGCGATTLYLTPEDPGERGPWRVGASTVTVGRLTTEVWYPVAEGAQAGSELVDYDIREHLAAAERSKIPDAEQTPQPCDCYRDAPIDESHGPYPVVVFIHGTASFRTQSLTQMVHWASRGFVVIAADHPGLKLSDVLALLCPHEPSGDRDIEADVSAMLAAVAGGQAGMEFLAGRVDLERVAITGHSAGGSACAALAGEPGVRVVIPMASGAPAAPSELLESSLFLAGNNDSVVPVDASIEGYEATDGAKRLVILDNAGHLAFSDLCSTTNQAGEDILEVASNNGICGTDLGAALFDCSPDLLNPAAGARIIDYATTLVLEEHLHCRERDGDPWAAALERFADIAEIRQSGL